LNDSQAHPFRWGFKALKDFFSKTKLHPSLGRVIKSKLLDFQKIIK
jgi:hypothetical protein